MFNDGEQKVLDTYEEVLKELKKDLTEKTVVNEENNNNFNQNEYFFTNDNINEHNDVSQTEGQNRGFSRVLTMEGMPKTNNLPASDDNYNYNYSYPSTGNTLDNSASSFVLIVAAVLALIAIVVVVTLSILNYINGF